MNSYQDNRNVFINAFEKGAFEKCEAVVLFLDEKFQNCELQDFSPATSYIVWDCFRLAGIPLENDAIGKAISIMRVTKLQYAAQLEELFIKAPIESYVKY
jgi:hypothetical protein